MVITEKKDEEEEEEEEEKEGLMIDRYVFYPTSESHQISGLSNFICLYFFLFACNFLNRCYRLQIVLTGRAHGWPLIRVSPEQEMLSTGRGQRAILAFDSFERFLIEIHSKGVNVELVEKLLLHQERRFTVICYVRSKLKQTEMECEYLKRWFGSLMGQNRRLQREVDKLRAVNNHGLCTQAEQLWCFCILFFWNFLIAAKLGISIASWFQLCQVNINPFSSPSGANASCSYDLASKFQGVYFVVSKSSRAAASANTMAQTMVSKSTTLLLLEKKQQWILPQQHQWQL